RESLYVHSFFFQAEDGIRDSSVTGVQTCALPICAVPIEVNFLNITAMMDMMTIILVFLLKSMSASQANLPQTSDLSLPTSILSRSEERRVGKEGESRREGEEGNRDEQTEAGA